MTDMLPIKGLTEDSSDEDIREKARLIYALHSNDDIEIKNGGQVYRGEEGAWVAAWVWLRFEERCTQCNGPNNDGEGWDDLCSSCADKEN
jgi:hypothetical protein